jgi:hypothetical protein
MSPLDHGYSPRGEKDEIRGKEKRKGEDEKEWERETRLSLVFLILLSLYKKVTCIFSV